MTRASSSGPPPRREQAIHIGPVLKASTAKAIAGAAKKIRPNKFSARADGLGWTE
jgi:hypothetical protein